VQFANVIRDECLTLQGYTDLDGFKQLINAADRLGFMRPGPVKSNRVHDIEGTNAQDSGSYGSFQTLVHRGGDEYVASGWAVLPYRGEPADAVLLAYEQADNGAIIFAIAAIERERDIVSAVLRRGRYGDARWRRSFTFREIPSSPVQLTAWSFDAYTGKAYKLNGAHATQKSVDSSRP